MGREKKKKTTMVLANLKEKMIKFFKSRKAGKCKWLQAGMMRVLTRVSDEATKAGTVGTTVGAEAKTVDEEQREATAPRQCSFWLSTDMASALPAASDWARAPGTCTTGNKVSRRLVTNGHSGPREIIALFNGIDLKVYLFKRLLKPCQLKTQNTLRSYFYSSYK